MNSLALATVARTLPLILVGGLVANTRAGLAVSDWPASLILGAAVVLAIRAGVPAPAGEWRARRAPLRSAAEACDDATG